MVECSARSFIHTEFRSYLFCVYLQNCCVKNAPELHCTTCVSAKTHSWYLNIKSGAQGKVDHTYYFQKRLLNTVEPDFIAMTSICLSLQAPAVAIDLDWTLVYQQQ